MKIIIVLSDYRKIIFKLYYNYIYIVGDGTLHGKLYDQGFIIK